MADPEGTQGVCAPPKLDHVCLAWRMQPLIGAEPVEGPPASPGRGGGGGGHVCSGAFTYEKNFF